MGLQQILGQAEGEQLRAELLGEPIVLMSVASDEVAGHDALPKTNSSPLKIGRDPKGNNLHSNHPFSGAFAVSFRNDTCPDLQEEEIH